MAKINKSTFAKGLSTFLQRTKIKKVTLANKLNFSSTMISLWLNEKSYPTYEKLIELKALGMTNDEIFGENSSKNLFESLGTVSVGDTNYVTIEKASKYLGNMYSKNIYKEINQGNMTHLSWNGRKLFSKKMLDDYIQSKIVPAKNEGEFTDE